MPGANIFSFGVDQMVNHNLFTSLIFSVFLFVGIQNSFAEDAQMCSLCGKPIQEGSVLFEVTYENGDKQQVGCPGCGLSLMSDKRIKSATTMDFLSRKIIDAKKAYYLKGTEVGFCCEPHWLSFSSKSDAEKFAKGFGGEVLGYEEAIKDIGHMSH